MKRYKLKRDLPTFSLGDEFILKEGIGLQHVLEGCDGAIIYTEATLEKFPNILTDWFEEIEEPLIKDEKIRKAVRAWAEANNFSVFRVNNQHFNYVKIHGVKDRYDPNGSNIEFMGTIAGAEKRTYEIDELCGEEEE